MLQKWLMLDDSRPDAGAPIRADPVDSHANSHADLDGTSDADASSHAGSAGDSASAGQQPSANPARALDEEFISPARCGEVPEWYNHENHANERSIMARSIAKLLLARKANPRGGMQLPREEPRDVWTRELLHTGGFASKSPCFAVRKASTTTATWGRSRFDCSSWRPENRKILLRAGDRGDGPESRWVVMTGRPSAAVRGLTRNRH